MTNQRTTFTLSAFLIIMMMVGCSDSPVATEDHVASISADLLRDRSYVPGRLLGSDLEEWRTLDNHEREALASKEMQPSHALSVAFREDPSPDHLAPLAAALVSELAGTPLATSSRQKASDYLLRAHLLQPDPDLDEVARHAEVLLSTHYSDARILVPALDVLNNYWSAERLTQARQQIREAARTPSLGKTCAEGCGAEQIIREMGDRNLLTTRERFEVDQALALSRL